MLVAKEKCAVIGKLKPFKVEHVIKIRNGRNMVICTQCGCEECFVEVVEKK